jgi:RNA polymerase sigma-70 factor (ECF subfamily)
MAVTLTTCGAALATRDVRPARTAPDPAPAKARMRALYTEHAGPLLRFLLRLVSGDRPVAEDLLQETMLRAWRAIEDLPADRESQRRWLWIVARRIAIDASRARQTRPTEVGAVDVTRLPDAGDPMGRVVAAHIVRKALPRLSVEHRTVLVDIYFHRLPTAEIAARLGIPEGTVKSRAHYALRTLRAIIGSLDGE